ncbi:glycine--tRNA ligase [Limnoglobus roseus]|uniref:Glycine--tRNA ligase n=1 Tax=Limnoglobus roseus TaxID=2598579 RepID=A0A5C1AKE5_9BACT|nr:glycine--tRNA ligase [Limnoglobus roseus]QEL18182.1 glycine--tRNA ligase [Limnoglobus roseus]
MPTKIDMAKFAKFCKDTGFIFQSSEIYGGINGFWDYGPLGVELKKNIKDAWWQDMVRNPPPGPDGQEIRMVGLDCSIIMNPQVWVASGHAGGFADPMVSCKAEGCKKLFRADQQWVVAYLDPRNEDTKLARLEERTEGMKSAVKEGLASKSAAERDATMDAALATSRLIAESCRPDFTKTVTASSAEEAKELATLTKQEQKMIPNLVFGYAVPLVEYMKTPKVDAPRCPACGEKQLTEPRAFNLMFESHAGPIASEENKVYLRPETAQGIFANYRNVLNSTRLKLPFGIAQVGKAFRNEINPRNFTFRSREFEQMEIEFFCHPSESMKWYEYWRDLRKKWYSTLGIKSDNLVPREQGKEELAHYSIGTTDIEYMFPFSDEPQELEGVAHRGAFDLTAHAKHSGKADDLAYFDEELWNNDSQTMATRSFKEWLKSNPTVDERSKYKYVPHVIEPSAGADRFTLAVLTEAYSEDQVPDAKGKLEERVVMRFHPRLAPVKCAVFPLVNKDGMPEKALKLYRELKAHFNVVFDDKGAVGRRYRRQDEIGTPFCVTIDGDTMTNDTVTIRDRDSMQQRRIPISEVKLEVMKSLMG